MKKIIYGSADFEQQLQSLYDRPAFPPAAEEAAPAAEVVEEATTEAAPEEAAPAAEETPAE